MAKFVVNSYREDPYRNFKFKVKIDNEYVAGLHKCSALKRTIEVVDWREGGDPTHSRKLVGKASFEPITLEQGVTHDTTFEGWAKLVHNYSGDAAMSLKNFRKDIVIDVCNLQGNVVLSYLVYRCWVSEYTALPDLDAAGNSVMISSIILQNEGWERDESITEPTET
ncbi:MAG: phage tail protein [Gammaproteobacteria bacterium]|nr:phage tail protein [Gammaproteobacteria bacterium]